MNKQLFKNWRILLMIFFVLIAIWTIQPKPWNDGVVIKAILPGSAAAEAGIAGPEGRIRPMQREKITAINNQPIKDPAYLR